MEKIRTMLTGYNGKMGRNVIHEAEKNKEDILLSVGIDINPAPINVTFPVFMKPSDFGGKVDVILDFSHHAAIDSLLEYAVQTLTPIVIATTGHTEDERKLIEDASKQIPIFLTANMSLGINLLIELAKKATATLKESFDIEIIEKHHNQKLDAPSGTAYMIANEISEVMDTSPVYKYDRQNERKTREKNEIGIHSIRGGTIIGEHEVIFAGQDEVISISHSAISKDMFSSGAVAAVKFIHHINKSPSKENRIYNMSDLLTFKNN